MRRELRPQVLVPYTPPSRVQIPSGIIPFQGPGFKSRPCNIDSAILIPDLDLELCAFRELGYLFGEIGVKVNELQSRYGFETCAVCGFFRAERRIGEQQLPRL